MKKLLMLVPLLFSLFFINPANAASQVCMDLNERLSGNSFAVTIRDNPLVTTDPGVTYEMDFSEAFYGPCPGGVVTIKVDGEAVPGEFWYETQGEGWITIVDGQSQYLFRMLMVNYEDIVYVPDGTSLILYKVK